VWTGINALLGRVIRVTGVKDGRVSFEVIAGSQTVRPIAQHTLLNCYRLSRDPRNQPVAVNGEELTVAEGQAISAFQRLADRWPGTLKLVTVNGELRVLHAGSPVRESSVLEVIRGMAAE
jgi:hypothetical protein